MPSIGKWNERFVTSDVTREVNAKRTDRIIKSNIGGRYYSTRERPCHLFYCMVYYQDEKRQNYRLYSNLSLYILFFARKYSAGL